MTTPLLTAGDNYIYHAPAENVLRWMPDKSVDIVVTSPPYNLQRKNRRGGGIMKNSNWSLQFEGGYENYDDDLPECDYQVWLQNIVRECLRISKGIVWVNHKTRYRDGVGIHPLSFLPFPFWSEIIWDRGGSFVMNSRRFAPSHEFVYGFGTPHHWNDISNKLMSVWRIVPVNRDDGHPCPYPEQLVERLITASCPERGIVFDPFIGSGTTAAVAQRLNRRYLGCDVSSEYVKLSNERLAKPFNLQLFSEATA